MEEAVGKLRVKAVGVVKDGVVRVAEGGVGVAVGDGPEEVMTIGVSAVTSVLS